MKLRSPLHRNAHCAQLILDYEMPLLFFSSIHFKFMPFLWRKLLMCRKTKIIVDVNVKYF
jgi:hypothetical protein